MGVNLDKQPTVANLDPLMVSDHSVTINVEPSPSGTESMVIGVQQPIAHEVGMLSLSNSVEPKYIGPSSGVTFAELIYTAVPEPQGLVTSAPDPRQWNRAPGQEQNDQAVLPDLGNIRFFIDAYFESIHVLYPFLDEMALFNATERIRRFTDQQILPVVDGSVSDARVIDQIDHAKLFLVLFLGASFLETRLSQDFRSESYLVTAMAHVSLVSLHESLSGSQTLILLTLSSLHSLCGLNGGFLKSTIEP